ncbi:MAG: SemiSWEET transporter [Burkholderiales bacterium]
MVTDIIGMCAGTLTTAAFLPQVFQVIKTRSTQDISLVMYLIFTTGIVFWLAYGLLLGAWPVIIANIITFILALIVLVMKLKHG